MVTGNWGITAGPRVEWLAVAVLENQASPQALANGPAVNDTVTGTAIPAAYAWPAAKDPPFQPGGTP